MFQFWLPRSTVVTSHKLTKFAPNHPVPDMCVHDHIQIKNSSRGHATQMPRRKSCLQCNAQRTSFEGSNQAAQSRTQIPLPLRSTTSNFWHSIQIALAVPMSRNSGFGALVSSTLHLTETEIGAWGTRRTRLEPQIPAFQFRLITISLVIG